MKNLVLLSFFLQVLSVFVRYPKNNEKNILIGQVSADNS